MSDDTPSPADDSRCCAVCGYPRSMHGTKLSIGVQYGHDFQPFYVALPRPAVSVPRENPRGRIFATCGHEISDEWDRGTQSQVIRKSQSREGGRALSYEVLCSPCRANAEARGELFASKNRAEKWLMAKTRRRLAALPEKPGGFYPRLEEATARVKELESENAGLRTECSRLREDAARLDWLDREPWWELSRTDASDNNGVGLVNSAVQMRSEGPDEPAFPALCVESVRTAIDAARSSRPENSTNG